MEMLCGGLSQQLPQQDSWSYSPALDEGALSDSSSTGHYEGGTGHGLPSSGPGFYPQPLCPSPEPAAPGGGGSGMQLPIQLPGGGEGCHPQFALQMWDQCRRTHHQMMGFSPYHHHLVHHPHHHHHHHHLQHHPFSHHPHPNTIARRNERERNRVKTINSTFVKLRQHLPCSSKSKKLSKVQILRSAIQYISQLAGILESQEQETAAVLPCKVEPEEEEGATSEEEDTQTAESAVRTEQCAKVGEDEADEEEGLEDDDEEELENLVDMGWLQ